MGRFYMKPNLLRNSLIVASVIIVIITENGFGVLSDESLKSLEPPAVGAHRKNYAGQIVYTITNTRNSEATLPKLTVEDHIWEGKSLQLSCKAAYPVKWTYSGPGSPPVHLETFREAPELYSPSTYNYLASVTFTHTTERQTGNYSCISIQDPNLLSYIYLFVPGKNVFVSNSETNGSATQTVYPKDNDSWVTLPCAVSVKETQVRLYKTSTSGNVEEVPFGDNLTFDPKFGFRLKWRGPGITESFGKYYCKGHLDDHQEKLHLKLAPPKYVLLTTNGGSENTNENQLSYFEDSHKTEPAEETSLITFHYDKPERRIRCCSSDKTVRPKMFHSRCESISDCEVRRIYVEHKSCFPKCEHLYTKVGANCLAYELASYSDSGIIECSVRDTGKSYYQFSYNDGIFISDFSKLPPLEKILRIIKENPSKNGKGMYSCLANSFFFSHGLRWGVRNKNGALEIIKEERFPAKHERLIDEKENTAAYCFAPIWNSQTEWRNVSISITSN